MMTSQTEQITQFPGKVPNTNTSVEEVFAKYEEVGFLYPAKKQLLQPHMPLISDHWKRLLAAPDRLLRLVNATKPGKHAHFASICVWKAANFGLFAQHLVSTGNPHLSLKVMLQAQAEAEHQFTADQVRSSQNWFRPNNRYAYRVFASMYNKLGDQKAALIRQQYLHLPLHITPTWQKTGSYVKEVFGIDPALIRFVEKRYGRVFVRAEELDQSDIQLKNTGELYGRYGLSFSRRVFKICDQTTHKVQACLIANRPPLGLNFSFLENRAYYIVEPDLSDAARLAALSAMHYLAHQVYCGIPIGAIPIVTDEQTARELVRQGAHRIREYMQSIWLREGFAEWHEHIDSFLLRIERRS